MSYELRIDPDSPIKPKIRTHDYTVRCKCGGTIDVRRMIAIPSLKEGWLAVCRNCRATSGIQELYVEAEGCVIGNALEKINAARDGIKNLKERLKERNSNKQGVGCG